MSFLSRFTEAESLRSSFRRQSGYEIKLAVGQGITDAVSRQYNMSFNHELEGEISIHPDWHEIFVKETSDGG